MQPKEIKEDSKQYKTHDGIVFHFSKRIKKYVNFNYYVVLCTKYCGFFCCAITA